MSFDAEKIRRLMPQDIPQMRVLGIEILDISQDEIIMRLPYNKRLIGNPATGVLHGGAITTLLDTASGLSVHARLQDLLPLATLDLRIDYLRPARPPAAVMAVAECYRVTQNVAFTRAIAYQDRRDHAVAQAAGSFMLATAGPKMDPSLGIPEAAQTAGAAAKKAQP